MRDDESGDGQFDDVRPETTDHEGNGTFRMEFDVDSMGASDAVISAVARTAGRDPVSLPRLYRTIDPDALDRVFAPLRTGPGRSTGSITFEYADHVVTVYGHGAVEVKPPE